MGPSQRHDAITTTDSSCIEEHAVDDLRESMRERHTFEGLGDFSRLNEDVMFAIFWFVIDCPKSTWAAFLTSKALADFILHILTKGNTRGKQLLNQQGLRIGFFFRKTAPEETSLVISQARSFINSYYPSFIKSLTPELLFLVFVSNAFNLRKAMLDNPDNISVDIEKIFEEAFRSTKFISYLMNFLADEIVINYLMFHPDIVFQGLLHQACNTPVWPVICRDYPELAEKIKACRDNPDCTAKLSRQQQWILRDLNINEIENLSGSGQLLLTLSLAEATRFKSKIRQLKETLESALRPYQLLGMPSMLASKLPVEMPCFEERISLDDKCAVINEYLLQHFPGFKVLMNLPHQFVGNVAGTAIRCQIDELHQLDGMLHPSVENISTYIQQQMLLHQLTQTENFAVFFIPLGMGTSRYEIEIRDPELVQSLVEKPIARPEC